MPVRINPSILAADFAHLARELDRISSADAVHVDVMDNHFVPNLTFGIPVVERLLQVTELPLDMHLMITDVDRWAPSFAELGVFSVTFHAEATDEPVALARRLRQIGARAGLAIKPGTPVEPYLEVLDEFDQLLVMTVEPGFGGQSFMPETMGKLVAAREVASRSGLDVWLQVDGGINLQTIEVAARAGADTFVAGSSVFGADDAGEQVGLLRQKALEHTHVA
ncbi:ribulose-phosphate 3-epimerase [Agreia sp. PsM10]|jgi:ribulose-phosphate 3-epimerase|uniref:ribulose-phosphate 3-epimerase n=1 Tax=Agreia sp. PsM10 TaxID=3030533 RepID=UPI00263BAEB6|nr:ribulose-phosphate 3-epimerase [Agreia sp. PsM10]MDN4639644.1 ribulose-phosphate 3-epimerase [Agreia sp. PsM10]